MINFCETFDGGVGIFGFSVLAIFYAVFFLGFFTEKHRFFGFCVSFVSIWLLVFGQNTRGFSDLVSNAVFGFACSVSGFLNREHVPREFSNRLPTQTSSQGLFSYHS